MKNKFLASFDRTKKEIPLPPTGNQLICQGWHQEAALRCLLNNLHPQVAENRNELIVYGGIGKAARNFNALYSIIDSLLELKNDQTLLIQSGKPVAIFPSRRESPRVLIANSNLVPHWANWNTFNELDKAGLMMYGQMTAGSWIYIGTQGILQGTYETFMAAAQKHFNSHLAGKIVLSAGLGGMGGAQPLAVKMAGGVFIGCDIDPKRIEKRLATKYVDFLAADFLSAWQLALKKAHNKEAFSIAVTGNAVDFFEFIIAQKDVPDLVTDQTSAHDPLNGYVPQGLTLEQAQQLRQKAPQDYIKKSYASMNLHVSAMNKLLAKGAFVFDYGNNLRAGAREGGHPQAFSFPGFVPAYIRPLFCQGSGPFRWIALSGNPEDIAITDEYIKKLFPENKNLQTWLNFAQEHVQFQGLPARICWLKYGEREKAALLFNQLVRDKKVSAPIVIGRDHLDCGSVASPYRETENMKDGSDAVSDWPLLNAMINIANGGSWISLHHGGGVGMGYSQHSGMVIVCDGSMEMDTRLKLVLNSDPGMGIVRHVDAGYSESVQFMKDHQAQINFKIPML